MYIKAVLSELAVLHSSEKLWVREDFLRSESPLAEFFKIFPGNHFSLAFKEYYLPSFTNTERLYQDSPDFPFWGADFFSTGKRILVVAESAAEKGLAVSNTIYSMLWSENIREYTPKLKKCFEYWDFSRYYSYLEVLIDLWELSPENIFITDAHKYNMSKHKGSILRREISIIKPDFILPLGAKAYESVTGSKVKKQVATKIRLGDTETKVIYCPFPAGLGRTRKEFPETLAYATRSIWEKVHGLSIPEIIKKVISKRRLIQGILPTRSDKFFTSFDSYGG
ncbi:MAG: uracil-DNA glycosylase family protein [Firmicutes bacterium]|nr:uracil-DNA glycosylase family protein [Bacillota bacterium]